MATLLKSIEDVKKYVSVNKNMEWESLSPYVIQADRKYIKTLVGDALYDTYSGGDPAEANPKKVYELLLEASANLAWFLYLPLANVQVTDSGVSVAQGDNYKAAEWWQIRDLRRSFLDAGFTALDEALKIMEANDAEFASWKGTDGYTIFKELFVKRTDTFNRWFNISNSRRTFLALRPYMLEAHHQFFKPVMNEATIATINFTAKPLNTLSLELAGGVKYMVLDLMQAAQVNFTVYKAIHSGTFELTSNGIYEKLEEFPGYRTKTLEEAQLYRIKNERLVAAEEYLKSALKLVAANPGDFPDYETKTGPSFINPKNTKSIVSF
ncbi:MAG: DUF6712 family protein [Saonia sp.]